MVADHHKVRFALGQVGKFDWTGLAENGPQGTSHSRKSLPSSTLATDPDKDPKQCRKGLYSFPPARCSLHFPARHQIFRRQVSRLYSDQLQLRRRSRQCPPGKQAPPICYLGRDRRNVRSCGFKCRRFLFLRRSLAFNLSLFGLSLFGHAVASLDLLSTLENVSGPFGQGSGSSSGGNVFWPFGIET